MKRIFCCFLILLTVHMLRWALASSRVFAASHGFQAVSFHDTGIIIPQPPQASSHLTPKGLEGSASGSGELEEEDYVRERVRNIIGSSPPDCEHKCYGCVPCEAIQVPTTSGRGHGNVALHYANYEPERWRCKCGPIFYTP